MIDIDAITTSIVQICATAVGSDLSLMGTAGNLPAVIRDRQNGNIPKYHYIVVDHITETDVDGWVTNISVNESDKVEYTTDKLLVFRLTCYGTDGNQIMQKLKSKLRFESLRDRLRSETGAAFSSETVVKEIPQIKGVEWIENGFMDITISCVDTESDDSSTTIDTIGVTGKTVDALGVDIVTTTVNVP